MIWLELLHRMCLGVGKSKSITVKNKFLNEVLNNIIIGSINLFLSIQNISYNLNC